MTSIRNSSNVVGVLHNPQTNVLTVKYASGGIYDYQHVTTAMHKALIRSGSRGSWISNNLVKKPVAHPAKRQEEKK